jgi:flagellar basal-body rod protein FlgC
VTSAVSIAQSGLAAATLSLNASASNLANIDDTSPVGATTGYTPSQVIANAAPGGGVTTTAVTAKPSQLIAYIPSSAIATAQGLVQMPDIDPISEVTNQLQASTAFAYSLQALKVAQQEQQSLLDITS